MNDQVPATAEHPLLEKIHASIPGRAPHAIGYREALAMLAIHRQDVPGIEEAIEFAIVEYQQVHGDRAGAAEEVG